MGYIEENLRKDEKVLIKAEFSMLACVSVFVAMVVAIIIGVACKHYLELYSASIPTVLYWYFTALIYILIVSYVLAFFVRIFTIRGYKLAVTTKRVFGKMGLFSIKTIDVPIDKIDSISVEAGFFGNLFHFYTLKVLSVGGAKMGNKDKKFLGVKNAMVIKNIVNDAIEKHAEEARRAQAEEIAAAMVHK